MKAVKKSSKPDVLVTNEFLWRDEYVAERQAGNNPKGKWGHDDIRKALSDETAGCCVYCEAWVGHVAYENVEHVRPKSEFPEEAHEWSNLLMACPVCNTNKGTYWNSQLPIVDPSTEDPAAFVRSFGPLVVPSNASERGEISIQKLRLNRFDLVRDRSSRILSMLAMLTRWRQATGPLKNALADAIRIELGQGEYSMVVESLLESEGFPSA